MYKLSNNQTIVQIVRIGKPISGNVALPPGSIKTEANEIAMNFGEAQTKTTEQFTDSTLSAEYKITYNNIYAVIFEGRKIRSFCC